MYVVYIYQYLHAFIEHHQLALVVFSCHQLVQRSHLHLKWTLSATCTGGVFPMPTSALSKVHTWLAIFIHPAAAHCNLHWWCFSSTNQAFTNVHTYKWAPVLQLALCGGKQLYIYIAWATLRFASWHNTVVPGFLVPNAHCTLRSLTL